MSWRRSGSVLLLIAIIAGCRVERTSRTRVAREGPDQPLAHGVAAGEVSATSAIVWARCKTLGEFTIELRTAGGNVAGSRRGAIEAVHDYTVKARFDDLQPATSYEYRIWCHAGGVPTAGRLRTAPVATDPAPVRFAWSGDLGGQNVCRDRSEGYVIFDRIGAVQPDFFVALGDMIYADNACTPMSRYDYEQVPNPPTPATTTAEYWAIWRYNRADRHFQRFLAAIPYYAVWDDHEIMDDPGPERDMLPKAPGVHLMPPARQAFIDYQPMLPPADPPTLYRRARWGKHVELFILDTRSHRDRNDAADRAEAPKTMLGREQAAWFLDALRHSDATWKVIVSSVPISIPTSMPKNGRDGWANLDEVTGFENELVSLLRTMQQDQVRNMLWITTDVHFATGFRYRPFADDPAFAFHEFVTGPLNAGIFPQLALDATLHPERLFLYAPSEPRRISGFEDALSWFNFTVVDVDASGKLSLRVVNGQGTAVYSTTLEPQAVVAARR